MASNNNHPKDSLLPSISAPELGDTSSAHGISIKLPPGASNERPPAVTHVSTPAYPSPIRHHQRTPSRSKAVKETLNAHSHYGSGDDGDGSSVHRINQYIIKQEIGRGSFGSVHLAEDQYGKEFAVKEFSKSRLRKRAQSNLLRKPNQGRRPGQIAAGLGFNSPLHRLTSSESPKEANNSLSLIKEEIAIMKKLNHNNLVSLIEVLDDPQEDSLYMVLEMCKKGVAMNVGLDERADPYDDETCRCWFRDMILGIEYLHAQGIIHRDIKPDNCLITDDDVLKIVDFGVSEMFEKASDMATAKSAGSPAFMPPELCVARHGQVSGRAADIWSMGVTLYCLRYGHIPFEKDNLLELYDSIRSDDVPMAGEKDNNFDDLMRRILQKDPEKRITMEKLREHPWVTKDGTDPLLSAEENCADIVDPPTEAEMDNAITGNMAHVLAVIGAVKKFKDLLRPSRGRTPGALLGLDSNIVAPPESYHPQSRSQETFDRRAMDTTLAASGVHREVHVSDDLQKLPQSLDKVAGNGKAKVELNIDGTDSREEHQGETKAHFKQRMETKRHQTSFSSNSGEHRRPYESRRALTFPTAEHARGQAHDPLEDTFFLNIGHDPEASAEHEDESGEPIVSESPPAVEMDIYEQAYKDEMERIVARRGEQPSMYLTRRVEHRDDIRTLNIIKDAGQLAAKHAVATFDQAMSKGSTAGAGIGEAGRNAARAAADTFAKGTSTQGGESTSWLELVRSAANDGMDASRTAAQNAKEAYNKSGTMLGGLTNVVTAAQAQARGEPSQDTVASPTKLEDDSLPSFPSSAKRAGQQGSDRAKANISALTSALALNKKS